MAIGGEAQDLGVGAAEGGGGGQGRRLPARDDPDKMRTADAAAVVELRHLARLRDRFRRERRRGPHPLAQPHRAPAPGGRHATTISHRNGRLHKQNGPGAVPTRAFAGPAMASCTATPMRPPPAPPRMAWSTVASGE
ncbi:hypothetical protein ACP70R_003836 [Stipagrostis hirtigluma subsp. patula]